MEFAATVGNIVSHNDTHSKARWKAAVALAFALWIVVVGAQWGSAGTDVPPPHGPHALSGALHAEVVQIIEHPHLRDGSTPVAPDTLAEAVLPRTANVLLVLGLCGAVVMLAVLWRQSLFFASRGPPRPFADVLTGRVLLTRHCIARR